MNGQRDKGQRGEEGGEGGKTKKKVVGSGFDDGTEAMADSVATPATGIISTVPSIVDGPRMSFGKSVLVL